MSPNPIKLSGTNNKLEPKADIILWAQIIITAARTKEATRERREWKGMRQRKE